MKKSVPNTPSYRVAVLPLLAALLLPSAASAHSNLAARTEGPFTSGWSMNFTPALFAARGGRDLGGGVDPEVRYTVDLGSARLSAGGRLGAYYARNVLGLTAMPTMRLIVPVGPVEPYVAFGIGYGSLPRVGHDDLATMSRAGVVFRISERFSLGMEGTFQRIEGSEFSFPSLGSMVSFDL